MDVPSSSRTRLDTPEESNRVSSSRASTRNAPPEFATGAKIATFCTVCLTIGLAVPLVIARRRSAAGTSTPIHVPSANNHALHRKPSGISPSVLLRQSSTANTSTTGASSSSALAAKPVKLSMFPARQPKETPIPTSVDAVFHGMKALGVATGLVTVSAGAIVLSFRFLTGITTVAEFTPYMQRKLIQILPASLTARLDPSDDPQDVIFPSSSSSSAADADAEDATAAAERRMQAAYAEGGVVAFGKQMWVEFEREWADASIARQRTPRKSSGGATDAGVSGAA